MISASHNPYYDNGIKLIDCYGEKMPEETLLLVADYIDGKLHVFDLSLIHILQDLWRRRAEHYYSEFARAEKGAELWRKGCLLYTSRCV